MVKAYRGALLHMLSEDEPVFHADGVLVVDGGHIAASGAWADLAPTLGDAEVAHFPGRLITPGFVDAHVHFPQTDIIASWSGQLLEWLETLTFPAEQAFADPVHAAGTADAFLAELLRNGTTTALVFGSVHKASADALFAAAQARNMRLVAGKVLMDRNAPAGLTDTVEAGRADTEALIRAWHGKGRLGYAVTPRFAVTSSDAQLAMAGEVAAAHPDVLVQTHMAENPAEIAEALRLFPGRADYLDIYDHFGLVGPRTVIAHCVHCDGAVFRRMAAKGASAAFCPSSNFMLGSGLFDLPLARASGVTVGLGTDVGGGASFSMLRMIEDAYKAGQLRGAPPTPFQAFHLATLGGAKALRLDDRIGNLAPGKEADFLVLDPAATPLLARRTAASKGIEETLFALAVLGDDRAVARTYVDGTLAHSRDA